MIFSNSGRKNTTWYFDSFTKVTPCLTYKQFFFTGIGYEKRELLTNEDKGE
jgi:hypothetical protein